MGFTNVYFRGKLEERAKKERVIIMSKYEDVIGDILEKIEEINYDDPDKKLILGCLEFNIYKFIGDEEQYVKNINVLNKNRENCKVKTLSLCQGKSKGAKH